VLAAVLLLLVAGGLSLAIWSSHRQSPNLPHTAAAPKPVQEAALTPPPRMGDPRPAWMRFAVPAPPSGNRPLVAVVIDDLGLDRARTAEVIRLPGPLTLSFMTYADELAQQTEMARRAGHELFLHVPMEAVDRREDPGPHGLFTSQSRDEILDQLR
jgi:hypothetical protein